MFDEDSNSCDLSVIKHATHLYELRHYCNVFGLDEVSRELHADANRVERLYRSDCHGSVRLKSFLRTSSDEKFLRLLEEFEKENRRRIDTIDEVIEKNEQLVEDLREKRNSFAGIGTNKVKRRLNKIGISHLVARAVRTALEIEDKNISAKNSYGEYKDKIYKKKAQLIIELCKLFKDQGWVYGLHKSTVKDTSHVIYFEIPGCRQLSWHFTPEKPDDYPVYMSEWDREQGSTLTKLEVIVLDILRENWKA